MSGLTLLAVVVDIMQTLTPRELAIMFARMAMYSSFIWVPFVFIAYALGRRRWSLWFLLAFTAAEATAVFAARWIWHGGWTGP